MRKPKVHRCLQLLQSLKAEPLKKDYNIGASASSSGFGSDSWVQGASKCLSVGKSMTVSGS